jgi:mono/diheme cytochrome c family protein
VRKLQVHNRSLSVLIVLTAFLGTPIVASSEAASPASLANKGFATIKEILDTSCAACHDWTGSWESITAGGRVVPGSPDKSILYQKISTDEMPAEGDKLTPEQKAFIRGWIAAGAPSTGLPIAVSAADTQAGAARAAGGFLFFPSKVAFHEVAGFTSTALFVAAGIIGGIHIIDLMDEGHRYRDSIGWDEDTGDPAVRSAEIRKLWGDQSALRWWHVGLVAAGETLYLSDALTGISMFTDSTPGKLTKHDIHRYAFFVHGTLMVGQVVLGFLTSDALRRGDHDAVIGLGVAHGAVGIAIPLVMLGAGLENLLLPE